jgi:hypothetical protein
MNLNEFASCGALKFPCQDRKSVLNLGCQPETFFKLEDFL